jgi:hypothetical protein
MAHKLPAERLTGGAHSRQKATDGDQQLCMQDWHMHEAQHSQFKNHSSREPATSGGAGPPAVIFTAAEASTAGAQLSPGPGAYDMQEVMSIKRSASDARRKNSAAFAAPAGDRFGRSGAMGSQDPSQPGPGAYDSSAGVSTLRNGASSAFVSVVRGLW